MTRRRPRKPRKSRPEGQEDRDDRDDQDDQDDQDERLTSGQRYALLVAVLVILGVGVIFIDTILAWLMGLLGRAP